MLFMCSTALVQCQSGLCCARQVHGHLAAVPGRALGAVIAGLAGGLPPPAHAALAAFHADVVALLRAASGDGGEAAALQAGLSARLPALRAMAGAGAVPGDPTPRGEGAPGGLQAGRGPEAGKATASDGRSGEVEALLGEPRGAGEAAAAPAATDVPAGSCPEREGGFQEEQRSAPEATATAELADAPPHTPLSVDSERVAAPPAADGAAVHGDASEPGALEKT